MASSAEERIRNFKKSLDDVHSSSKVERLDSNLTQTSLPQPLPRGATLEIGELARLISGAENLNQINQRKYVKKKSSVKQQTNQKKENLQSNIEPAETVRSTAELQPKKKRKSGAENELSGNRTTSNSPKKRLTLPIRRTGGIFSKGRATQVMDLRATSQQACQTTRKTQESKEQGPPKADIERTFEQVNKENINPSDLFEDDPALNGLYCDEDLLQSSQSDTECSLWGRAEAALAEHKWYHSPKAAAMFDDLLAGDTDDTALVDSVVCSAGSAPTLLGAYSPLCLTRCDSFSRLDPLLEFKVSPRGLI